MASENYQLSDEESTPLFSRHVASDETSTVATSIFSSHKAKIAIASVAGLAIVSLGLVTTGKDNAFQVLDTMTDLEAQDMFKGEKVISSKEVKCYGNKITNMKGLYSQCAKDDVMQSVSYSYRVDKQCFGWWGCSETKFMKAGGKCMTLVTVAGVNPKKTTSYTGWNDAGGINYLDRHQVDCQKNDFLSSLEFQESNGKFRIEYKCTDYNAIRTECEDVNNGFQSIGDHMIYMDRQRVTCPAGKFMTSYKPSTRGSDTTIISRCCKAQGLFPTLNPTPMPVTNPTFIPTEIPVAAPTMVPVAAPTKVPLANPTVAPVSVPTEIPISLPTLEPVASPTFEPTLVPVANPTKAPVSTPTDAPTEAPVVIESNEPTKVPVASPTDAPTESPVADPTKSPVASPTLQPTLAPVADSTEAPVASPTKEPVTTPTEAPVTDPTSVPVAAPTLEPVATPTTSPVAVPTTEPNAEPTVAPTPGEPTVAPTEVTFLMCPYEFVQAADFYKAQLKPGCAIFSMHDIGNPYAKTFDSPGVLACGNVDISQQMLETTGTIGLSYIAMAKDTQVEYFSEDDFGGSSGIYNPESTGFLHHVLDGKRANDITKSIKVTGSFQGGITCQNALTGTKAAVKHEASAKPIVDPEPQKEEPVVNKPAIVPTFEPTLAPVPKIKEAPVEDPEPAVAVPAATEAPVAEEASASVDGDLNPFERLILGYHNSLRGMCSAECKNMKWSSDLAAYAQDYATKLATENGCNLSHSYKGHNSYQDKNAGENLAMYMQYGGVDANTGALNAVNGWAGEGYGEDAVGAVTGHYTAMMWKDTTEVGCGYGINTDKNCMVTACNYANVAPNMLGQYDQQMKCTKPFKLDE